MGHRFARSGIVWGTVWGITLPIVTAHDGVIHLRYAPPHG